MKNDNERTPMLESSITLHALSRLFAALTSAFGKSSLLSALTKDRKNSLLSDSFIYGKTAVVFKRADTVLSKGKKAVSKQFSESKFLRFFKSLSLSLLKLPLRSYGIGLLLFGIYATAISAINVYSSGGSYIKSTGLAAGLLCVVAALVMTVSSKPLINVLYESSSAGPFIDDIVCVRCADVLKLKKKKVSLNYPILIGTVLGLFTFAVEPQYVIFLLLGVIFFAVCLCSPEFAIGLLLLTLPFLSEEQMLFFVSVAFVSYLLKLIRGKRVFTLGLTEALVILTGAVGIVRSLISPNGSYISTHLLICGLLLFICIRNMFRSRRLSVMLSGTLGYSFLLLYAMRIVFCLCSYVELGRRTFISLTPGLADLSAINRYGLLCMGFVLFSVLAHKSTSRKIFLFILLSVYITVVSVTESLGFTVCLIASVLIFAVASRRKSLLFAFPLICAIPLAYALFKKAALAEKIITLFVSNTPYNEIIGMKDFLFIFGAGGIILITAFAVSYLLKRHTLHIGADDELRSFYAATTCGFFTFILYAAACEASFDAQSLMLAVSAASLYSALSKSR